MFLNNNKKKKKIKNTLIGEEYRFSFFKLKIKFIV